MNLFITADSLKGWGGGSTVVRKEAEALASLGPCEVWDRDAISQLDIHHDQLPDPWKWDLILANNIDRFAGAKLAHFYAGTFSYTVQLLKKQGCRISYTCAAHDKELSRSEHKKLGIPYDTYYPHMVEPDLWKRYNQGYLDANVIVCPSQHSRACMESYGAKNVVVIPHGVHLPETTAPLPRSFRCGYLGAYGPDKGVRHLLEAWKQLNYKDGTLVLAGNDSTSPWVRHLINEYGGGNIELMGWVPDVKDFYNNISVLVQPSVSEGFGIEVLEALAYGRPVICSNGAGASDCLRNEYLLAGMRYSNSEGVDTLAGLISFCKATPEGMADFGRRGRECVKNHYTWDIVQKQYVETWQKLLSS